MDQDPVPYLDMKKHGATAAEVYRKGRGGGYKNHECLALIMGVFGLELDEARKIGHQFFYQERRINSDELEYWDTGTDKS